MSTKFKKDLYRSAVENTIKYDLNKDSYKNTFKISTRLKDQKFKNFLRLDVTSDEILATEEACVKLGSKLKLALQEIHDVRAKQCREFNIGLFFKRNWLFFGLINHTDVWAAKQAGKCPLDYSHLKWRVLWTANKDTKFGFDYGINYNGERYDAKAGVKTKIADDLEFKGEAAANGDIKVALKADVHKGWDVFVSSGFHARTLGGKGEAEIGFGVKGKI